jgi:hypothetical protein
MKLAYRRNTILYCILLFLSFFAGCKTDEFKFNELTVKEDFRIKLKSPLYTGTHKNGDILEFADFIHNWIKPVSADTTQPITVLQYTDREPRIIPTQLIFSPSEIIDSLAFLIDGDYVLDSIELVFNVINSCPFPLNTQIQFVQNGIAGPPILPPAFEGADFSQNPVQPVNTVHGVLLDSLQAKSLVESKRFKLTAWYDQNNFINENDTLSAHYPIDYSIVLIGQVKAKND